MPRLEEGKSVISAKETGERLGLFALCRPFAFILAATTLVVTHRPTRAQTVHPEEKKEITFVPGFRIQPHYMRDFGNANNDFYIARTRFKATGEIYDVARYGVEIKIDNVGRFAAQPNAQVENAWLDFGITPALAIRAGLYDANFSRNALTSDSKLLLMDRSLVKDALTGLGFADNTMGILVHGRPWGGSFEYSAGFFDNLQFEQSGTPAARQADGIMSMGRVVVHLLDPVKPGGYGDYQSSYIGQGQRLSIGANAGFLPKAREGVNEFDMTALGADLFFNSEGFTLEAEYDRFMMAMLGQSPDKVGAGWYAQGGYLFLRSIEFALRYQELDPDRNVSDDRMRWISVGLNIYLRGHNLKIQTEYTFKREEGNEVKNDVFQVQLQMDF